MKSKITRNILLFLLGFLGLGALGGGIMLILSPDGKMIGMPLEMLKNSPFENFLIPGILLFSFFGLFPMLLMYALLKIPESKAAELLNFFPDMHWAWTYTVYISFGLIIWLQVQMIMINGASLLHGFYAGLAIAILFVSLLPGSRDYYKKVKSIGTEMPK